MLDFLNNKRSDFYYLLQYITDFFIFIEYIEYIE